MRLLVTAREGLVDLYLDMGRWAGEYARSHWGGKAYILDLSYLLTNTQARSRGFVVGIREKLPDAEVVLSINAQSRYATAYQLTRDALTVHKKINVIFAINDATAWGAINACKDLHLDPESIIVMPFGLEGNTLKNALMEGAFCKIALAHLPEIVGPVCVEAAIAAFNHKTLPQRIVTPYVIVTAETLPDFYTRHGDRWELRWDAVKAKLSVPVNIDIHQPRLTEDLPRRIGFVITIKAVDVDCDYTRNGLNQRNQFTQCYRLAELACLESISTE